MTTEAEVSVQDRQTDLTDSLGVDFTEPQALEGSKNSEGPFAESSIPPYWVFIDGFFRRKRYKEERF